MQLKESPDAISVLDRAALLSFRPGRSGDIVYTVSRYVIVAEKGSSHGSPWSYDGRVPMIWLGPGIAPGDYQRPVSPVDIAPTLYELLGVQNRTSGRSCAKCCCRRLTAGTQGGRGHNRNSGGVRHAVPRTNPPAQPPSLQPAVPRHGRCHEDAEQAD
jgi:hypothetical protein